MELATFTCSICGDPSRTICAYCTKDACGNHLCERCLRCSDCCECGVRVDAKSSSTFSNDCLPASTASSKTDAA